MKNASVYYGNPHVLKGRHSITHNTQKQSGSSSRKRMGMSGGGSSSCERLVSPISLGPEGVEGRAGQRHTPHRTVEYFVKV